MRMTFFQAVKTISRDTMIGAFCGWALLGWLFNLAANVINERNASVTPGYMEARSATEEELQSKMTRAIAFMGIIVGGIAGLALGFADVTTLPIAHTYQPSS